MGSLARFGVSMEQELLNRFDSAISRKGYTNRSEAVRDLMRLFLIEEEWQGHQGQIVGTLTILYDHHSSRVNQALLELQHTHHETIASSLHIHLNEHLCDVAFRLIHRKSIVGARFYKSGAPGRL